MFVRRSSLCLLLFTFGCAGDLSDASGVGSMPNAPRDPQTPAPPSAGGGGGGGMGGSTSAGGGGNVPALGGTSSGGRSGGGPSEPEPEPEPEPTPTPTISVRLVPQASAGTERVSFAVPLARGDLTDESRVRVLHAGSELPLGTRALGRHGDGSLRSVELQFDLGVASETDVTVEIGQPRGAAALPLVPVESTLVDGNATLGPKVWALLPAAWLSRSGVAGAQVPEATVAGTPLAAWSSLCDYPGNDIDAFLAEIGDPAVWLYDRATVHYRGYVRRGDLDTLRTGYREAAIYRDRLSGTGTATRIGVPDKAGDVKYHYTQNLALHYLMTGDERFRESAEDVADRMNALWSPEYRSGGTFWTERHAGFGLLAYVWAALVSDDRAAELWQLAERAVQAYVDMHAGAPLGPGPNPARCFAHDGSCSPWMSAILADSLDAFVTERPGPLADRAKNAVVELGRMLARSGRDGSGKPYYQMHLGGGSEVDSYDEHWGESAYVIAMAWHYGGRAEPELETAARELIDGLGRRGRAPHLRSAGWQCRSAVATPYFLGY